ncbi:MAG: hypothetical protein RQ885_09775 [Desulfurococcales archaeon]|jgi:hypothetical protein|nr:hypothetical protein [Desulfurococcales archaeon]
MLVIRVDRDVLSIIRGLRSPILLYDNYCRLCYRFARAIWRLSRGRIAAVGMYSKEAMWLRSLLDPKIYSSVSWFILPGKDVIYGGRSSIVPILKEILIGLVRGGDNDFRDPVPTTCSEILPCSGIKGFIYRTIHILVKSSKIKIVY